MEMAQKRLKTLSMLQDPIEFKGVVFNEMKGVYSQPDSVNGTVTQQALFPDNTYSVDSGGNPTVIPDLTFEEFQVRSMYHRPNIRGDPATCVTSRGAIMKRNVSTECY